MRLTSLYNPPEVDTEEEQTDNQKAGKKEWGDVMGEEKTSPVKTLPRKQGYGGCLVVQEPRRAYKVLRHGVIAKLTIPEGASIVYPRRSGYNVYDHTRKLRCSKAKVEKIYHPRSGMEHPHGHSRHDNGFRYTQGEMVTPDNGFSSNPDNTCAPGIHVFATEHEAEMY